MLDVMSTEAEGRSPLRALRRVAESTAARIITTLVLLGVVALQINWGRMAGRVRHGHPLDFLLAVALVLAALIVGACRWWLLLQRADVRLSAPRLARVYAVSTFSGTFLPTTIGSDVTRALLVARRGSLLARVAITIVVDRAGGLVGLIGMAWIAFALHSKGVPDSARVFLAWVSAATLVGALLVTLAVFRGSRLARSLVPKRLESVARQSRSLVADYARDPWVLLVLVLSSLLFQALISLQLVMLARAIDVHLPFATAAVVLALVTVVTLIPISIGGFGVREGTYVVLLGGVSIAATDATLISLLSVATLFLASLPGALILARGGLSPALQTAPL
jgi:glycosyltransferase 2 family protein